MRKFKVHTSVVVASLLALLAFGTQLAFADKHESWVSTAPGAPQWVTDTRTDAPQIAKQFGINLDQYAYAFSEAEFQFVKPNISYMQAIHQWVSKVMENGDHLPWIFENKNGQDVYYVTLKPNGKLMSVHLTQHDQGQWTMSQPVAKDKK